MNPKNLTELTDDELLQADKQHKKAMFTDALLIGFLAGIVFYSVIKSTFGFLMLIPLFLIWKLAKKPHYNRQELQQLLKDRNLK